MVTFSDLFAFVALLIALVGLTIQVVELVIQISRNKNEK